MNLLSAENVGKNFSDQWLFKDLTLGLSQGEKVALVGNNGVGKTTLLRILSGEMPPDQGQVRFRDGIRIGVLTQQPEAAGKLTVEDILFDEKNEKAAAVKAYEEYLETGESDADTLEKLINRIEELQAWDYESKAKEIIGKLGVPSFHLPLGQLSGGQKRRVFMAQLLLQEPDLLILDEPTNHLDLSAIEWLENFLSSQHTTLIMVTHDRYFLDNVVTEIIELDRNQLFRYQGNYAYFLEKKTEREENLKSEVQKAKNLLKKELEWMRRQPKARGTKAKYRIDAFHELKQKASQDLSREKLDLQIKEKRQGGKILEVHAISKSYGELNLINHFSYIFKKKDRIGVIGRNGAGKSTLLDLLTGKTTPDQGEIIPGITTKVGYFTQESIHLNPTNRVIEEVKEIAEFVSLSDGSTISASKFLEQFLFPVEKQYTYIEKLSGGEKKRLQLLKLLVTNPNFLVLDEPTNDFDIDTLNVLEDFLEKFNGCLVLVSHDRYFMDNLVDQLFIFKEAGEIALFNGNYSDYRESENAQEVKTNSVSEKSPKKKTASSDKVKPSYKEKQEFKSITEKIETLETEKKALTEKLSSGAQDHEQLNAWSVEIQKVEGQLEPLMSRWMELSEIMEDDE